MPATRISLISVSHAHESRKKILHCFSRYFVETETWWPDYAIPAISGIATTVNAISSSSSSSDCWFNGADGGPGLHPSASSQLCKQPSTYLGENKQKSTLIRVDISLEKKFFSRFSAHTFE